MSATTTPHELSSVPTAAAVEALRAGSKLAVVTDEDDDQLTATRSVAVQLAARYDLEVVLYDRSQETWMDHPHPSGPCDRSELDDRAAGHLEPQLAEFTEAGVVAVPWISTVPSLTEIVDVIRDLDVDVILLPDRIEHPKLLDRLKGKQPADVVKAVAELNLARRVPVLVHDGGTVNVAD